MIIKGLTDKEYVMLEKLWSLDEIEDIQEWQSTLSVKDRKLSETLMEMIVSEGIDEESFNDDFDLSEANIRLNKIFNDI